MKPCLHVSVTTIHYTQAPSLTLTMRNHSSQKPATDIIEQPNDYQYKFSI